MQAGRAGGGAELWPPPPPAWLLECLWQMSSRSVVAALETDSWPDWALGEPISRHIPGGAKGKVGFCPKYQALVHWFL